MSWTMIGYCWIRNIQHNDVFMWIKNYHHSVIDNFIRFADVYTEIMYNFVR